MPNKKALVIEESDMIEEVAQEPRAMRLPRVLPVVPVRDQVYFPGMLFPLLVGREKSVRSLDEAISRNRMMVLVAQRDISTEEPEPADLYDIGVMVEVMQVLRVPDGAVRIMLEGVSRVRISRFA